MTTEHRYRYTCKNKKYKGHSSTNHLTIRQQNLNSKHKDASNFNLKHISKIHQFLTMNVFTEVFCITVSPGRIQY